jgi:AraC family transcriptional regulator
MTLAHMPMNAIADVPLAGERIGRLLRTRRIDGFVMRESRYPAGVHAPPHRHPDAYWCCVLGGWLDEWGGAGTQRYTSGSVHFHPAGDPHDARIGADGLVAISIVPDATLASRLRLERHDAVGPATPEVTHVAARCVREFHACDPASDLALQGVALELLATVLRQRETRERRPPAWLLAARDLLHAHVSDGVSLDVLAHACGAHPVHLVRAFRQHFGAPPGAYLRRLRVERARRSLLDTDLPIAAIAAHAGFAHQGHLTRVFRTHLGTTPARYRARHRTGSNGASALSA